MQQQIENQENEFKERRKGYYKTKYIKQRHIAVALVLVVFAVVLMQRG